MNELVQGLYLGAGFSLVFLAVMARVAMGIAMKNSSGDSFENAFAWVFVSPLALLGIYLIGIAAIGSV